MSPAAPVPVPWVQVGPGRYVRGEAPDPVPDRTDEPPAGDATEATNPEVGQPPEAVPEDRPRVLEGEDSTADPGGVGDVEHETAATTDLEVDGPSGG